MDTPQAGAVRRYETKKWNGLTIEGLPKRMSQLPKTITENKNWAMDQNNRLGATQFKEAWTTLTMELWEILLQLIRPFLPNSAYGTNNANNRRSYDRRPNQSFEKNDWSRPRNGSFNIESENWLNTGFFPVLHWSKRKTSHKTIHTANQEVITLTILLSEYLTIERRMVVHLRNRNCHKTITRRYPMWSASLQLTILLFNYQTFVR